MTTFYLLLFVWFHKQIVWQNKCEKSSREPTVYRHSLKNVLSKEQYACAK